MRRTVTFGLMLARMALTAWVGAATMFVLVALRPVRSPLLSSEEKAQLPLMLFPGYYLFGFILLGAALFGAILAWPALKKSRLGILATLLIAGSLGILIAERVLIYAPLSAMLQATLATGTAQSGTFVTYHQLSRWINSAVWLLSALAMLLVQRPEYPHDIAAEPTAV